MSNVRLVTRAFESVDLHSALTQDVSYMIKNGGRTPPPSLSRMMHEQKRLNDNLRYIMETFIRKNFDITVPDGTPTGLTPATAQNGSMQTLTSTPLTLASMEVSPAFTSDVFLQASVEVTVSDVNAVQTVISDMTIDSKETTVPGFTIPAVQHFAVNEDGSLTLESETPEQTIQSVVIAVPTISQQTAKVYGDARATIELHEDGVLVASVSQSMPVGTSTLLASCALSRRQQGTHTYALKAHVTSGQASVPLHGARLQVWAQAATAEE